MKQTIIALAVLTFICSNAKAQSSAYDINYKVCKVNDKYKACGEDDPAITNTKPKAESNVAAVSSSLRRLDTYVKPESTPRQVYTSVKGNPRFTVTYDDINGAYEGKDTKANGTVSANIERNINYLDNSVNLPPNDGGNNR